MRSFVVLLTAVLCLAVTPWQPSVAVPANLAEAQRFLVEFAPGTPPGEGARAVERAGGRVDRSYSRAFHGVLARMSPSAAQALSRQPGVESVEPDQVAVLATDGPASWGLDRADQRALPLDGEYSPSGSGAGVTAYVVDTGVRGDHAAFGGRVVGGYTAFPDGGTADCHGHGTHVAGTIGGSRYGMAPEVALVPVRVLNCDGRGYYSDLIAGLDWIAAHHRDGEPAVANLSLSGPASEALDAAVTAVIADGVTVVVAAGNSAADACSISPARAPAVLTVGATDITDARASFSNFGSCLDLFAPGRHITSAWHTDPQATAVLSGTSMAAPHVTGAAVLVLAADPTMSPDQVTRHLTETATVGAVTDPGLDSPNRLPWTNPALPKPPSTVDTTIVQGPRNGSFVLSRRATFRYLSSVTPVGFRCTLDDRARPCGDPSTLLTGLAPGTHTFTVAARDAAGRTDLTPATRTWTVPLNDSALVRSPGWRRLIRPGCYLGTCTKTTSRAARLSLPVEDVRRLALVASVGPGHGTVKVYLNAQLLKVLDLSAPQLERRRLFPIATFRRAQSGTVRIVSTRNRTVVVGGLGVHTHR